MIDKIENSQWDILIIGGGASGMGAAVDAASRGYKTLLIEQDDFGKSTSSKSTKLIHGGVRYLQQGNISLVMEALKERATLKKNAPHLVHDLEFIVPSYHWWDKVFYGIGLKFYDLLARKDSFGKSVYISKKEVLKYLPTIEQKKLVGGILYHDGQFDDTRLLISLMRTAENLGATVVNYHQFVHFIKKDGKIGGAVVKDIIQNKTFNIKAKVVINATGVFSDNIRLKDKKNTSKIIKGSQGVHIVLNKEFMPSNKAMMIPKTNDGRVLFAVPWHGKLIVGTTDTPVDKHELTPEATQKEIDFLLTHAAQYLTKEPTVEDIKSVFVGIRPLVQPSGNEHTLKISREHQIEISKSGLVSILGGKWTTYRKMGKDVVNRASTLAKLPRVKTKTRRLKLHGYCDDWNQIKKYKHFGSDAKIIEKIENENSVYKEKISEKFETTVAELIFAIRYEKAKTIEDLLARRTRLLFLDAQESSKVAAKVAKITAKELGKNNEWEQQQVKDFLATAKKYSWEK